MNGICECLVGKITNKLVQDEVISPSESEAYQFGIEVTLLKILHFLSYFAIALWMNRVVEFMIIFTVFYVFRRNVGGFHAKTRVGCYIFSCTIMFISLTVVGKEMNPLVMGVLVLCELTLLLVLAPVQNENRKLDGEEIIRFRRRLFFTSALFIFICTGTGAIRNWEMLWLLTIGLSLVTFSAVLGKVQSCNIK